MRDEDQSRGTVYRRAYYPAGAGWYKRSQQSRSRACPVCALKNAWLSGRRGEDRKSQAPKDEAPGDRSAEAEDSLQGLS